MTRQLRSSAVVALALSAVLLSAGMASAQFKVDRTIVTLNGTTPSALIKLDNTSTHEIRFDIKVMTWAVAPDGTDILTPAKDVTVVPALATLKAGGTQNIRVGSTGAAGAMERSYRLLVEELPGPTGAGTGGTVAMRTRFSIPVFVDPTKPEARIEVGPPTVAKGDMLEVEVKNVGTVHRFVDTIEFTVVDAKGGTVFATKSPAFGYLLINSTQKLSSVEKPTPAQCRAGAKLVVALTTRREVVTHEYPYNAATSCGK